MKVAVIQYAPALKNIEGNLRTAAKLVIEAAKGGAELIVLPEMATTGYSFMSAKEAEPFAEVISNFMREGVSPPRSMEVMGALASKYQIAIAWGVMEKDYVTGALHNSQVLMLPSQTYVSTRKMNGFGSDHLWFMAGTASPPIIDFLGKRVGLLICRDIRNKADKFTDLYEKGDADIVCFSSNFGDGGFPSNSWIDFAKDNRVWLLVSNR
jgi:predicted amidohydrolase